MTHLARLSKKKIIAGIMIIMVLVVMLFWTLHEATCSCHNGRGGECPVCALMHQYESAVYQLGDGAACQFALSIPLIPLLFILAFFLHGLIPETPISRKVRMDN